MSHRPQPVRLQRAFLSVSIPALLVLALVLGSHAYVLLAACWASVLLMTWRQSRARIASLDARRRITTGAFEDDEIEVQLDLINRGRRPVPLIEMVDHFGPSLQEERALSEPRPLPGRHLRRTSYHGICSRLWGVYTVGPIELATSDALGMYQPRRSIPEVVPFTIFPHVHSVSGMERLGARSSFTRKAHTRGRRGVSDLYMGIREYVTGDDPRRIHWPATARLDVPMVRENELDLVAYFSLFLDLDRGHRGGFGRRSTLEFVVRTAASMLATSARAGQFVQLFSNRASPLLVPPGRGEAHLELALQELVRCQQDAWRPLLGVVRDRAASLPVGSTAAMLLATSTPDLEELTATLSHLTARGVRPLVVLVNRHTFTALEARPPDRQLVAADERAVADALNRQGVLHTFLDAEDDIAARLAEGLFPA